MGDLDLPGGAPGGVLGAGGAGGAGGAEGAEGAADAAGLEGGVLTGGCLVEVVVEAALAGAGGAGGRVLAAGTLGAGADATFGAAVNRDKPQDLTSQQSSSTAMSLSDISVRTRSHNLPA
eukprot:s3272_g16.t1